MTAQEIEVLITALVEPLLEGTELTLVDVEYVKERKDWFLRIYIDKPGGVEIDDCQLISEKLTELLDDKDPIPDKYYLEISSPGIDRPLKKDADFEMFYGQKVDIVFKEPWEGLKNLVGVLVAHDAEALQVKKIIKGKEFKNPSVIARSLISLVRPHIDF